MKKLTADERIVLQEAARIKRRGQKRSLSEADLSGSGNTFCDKLLHAINLPPEESIAILNSMLSETSTSEEHELTLRIIRLLKDFSYYKELSQRKYQLDDDDYGDDPLEGFFDDDEF